MYVAHWATRNNFVATELPREPFRFYLFKLYLQQVSSPLPIWFYAFYLYVNNWANFFFVSSRRQYVHIDDGCRCAVYPYFSWSSLRLDVARPASRCSLWTNPPSREGSSCLVPNLRLRHRPLVSKGKLFKVAKSTKIEKHLCSYPIIQQIIGKPEIVQRKAVRYAVNGYHR